MRGSVSSAVGRVADGGRELRVRCGDVAGEEPDARHQPHERAARGRRVDQRLHRLDQMARDELEHVLVVGHGSEREPGTTWMSVAKTVFNVMAVIGTAWPSVTRRYDIRFASDATSKWLRFDVWRPSRS